MCFPAGVCSIRVASCNDAMARSSRRWPGIETSVIERPWAGDRLRLRGSARSSQREEPADHLDHRTPSLFSDHGPRARFFDELESMGRQSSEVVNGARSGISSLIEGSAAKALWAALQACATLPAWK